MSRHGTHGSDHADLATRIRHAEMDVIANDEILQQRAHALVQRVGAQARAATSGGSLLLLAGAVVALLVWRAAQPRPQRTVTLGVPAPPGPRPASRLQSLAAGATTLLWWWRWLRGGVGLIRRSGVRARTPEVTRKRTTDTSG